MSSSIPALAVLVALTAVPATVFADAGEGSFRLSYDERVLSLVHYPEEGEAYARLALFGTDLFLLRTHMLTLGLGYQLTPAIVIGSRVGFGYQEFPGAGMAFETGVFGLLPFVEILFGEGPVLPFVGGEAGFQILASERFLGGFGGGLETEAFAIFGGMGGVHIFVEDGFSISPAVAIDFLYFSSTEHAGWQAVLLISLEGWMGGGSAGRPAPATEPMRSADPAPVRAADPAPAPEDREADPETELGDPEAGMD